jgi:hypothetical protein
MVIPLAKPSPQEYGSALTYARRYAVSAIIGIVADEDDDGNRAQGHEASGRNVTKNPPRAKQNGNAKTAVDATEQKPSDEQMKQFHALGTEAYGPDWNEKRAELVEYATGGRTTSSKHLTLDEWQKLVAGMEKKLA